MFSKFLHYYLLSAFVLCCQHELSAQASLRKHHERLRKIQEEISVAEKEFSAREKKEALQLLHLSNLDLDIDLTQSLVQDLKKESEGKAKDIARIEANLKVAQEEVERLKEMLSKRLVYFYKYGRVKDLELLLTARSFNQGLLWLEYQKRLSAHDHRNYERILEKEAQIARDKELKTIELRESKRLLAEKLKEEAGLKRKKAERQKVLNSVRRSKELLRQQIAAKRDAAAEINRIIMESEQTPDAIPLLPPNTPFAAMKGKVPWPARGPVIGKFGRYRHPQLKTVTVNIGIDIQAGLGDDVQVVAGGRVTRITWQRGRGTIVIVRHYGGFYTVYTHLEKLFVNEFEDVEMGQVIGSVGESASFDGPVLHFEIWKGTEKLNPEIWLAKAT